MVDGSFTTHDSCGLEAIKSAFRESEAVVSYVTTNEKLKRDLIPESINCFNNLHIPKLWLINL